MADTFRAKYGGNKQKQQTSGDKATDEADSSNTDLDLVTLKAEVSKQVRPFMPFLLEAEIKKLHVGLCKWGVCCAALVYVELASKSSSKSFFSRKQ